MKGRIENENKIDLRVSKKLDDAPYYLNDYYYSLTDKSYTTKNYYLDNILLFLNFIQEKLDRDINDVEIFKEIKPSLINAYINSLKDITEGSKATRMYSVKNFFEYLVIDGYIIENPFNKVKIPKDNKEYKITYLTKNEIDILKNNILNGVGNDLAKDRQKEWMKRDYAIVMMSLSLGLRVTSLSEIDIDDVDFQKREITIVEKGNKIRSVAFSENLEEIIKDWLEDRKNFIEPSLNTTRALFVSKRRKRISSRSIAAIIEKYTYNIDKHITPHKLRSTCATNVYNSTGDIYLTADVLGHRNIANTRRYAQISEERKKQAAKAMDDILF